MLAISLCAGPAAASGTWSWNEPPSVLVPLTTPHVAVAKPARLVPIELDPVDACLRQAQGALRQRSFEAALGWFDHAVALSPGLPLAHLGRAVSLIELRRDEDAASALSDAYGSSAAPGETDLLLAKLYALGGERTAAMRQLGEALQAGPELADLARADPAFTHMRDHPHFLQVLGDL